MTSTAFATELARHGPAIAANRAAPTVDESFAYCGRLAKEHYENFVVASRLLPRSLRPHFASIYAYCRWADDLADETGSPRESLDLLDWWEAQLEDCYAGRATHPVFVALRQTIDEFEIPSEPLRDLLSAFRQDQRIHRYQTFAELVDYCRRSANPVGRLVLFLGRVHDAERGELSDSICTGLQLANFWQDVAADWRRGRLYIPLADCRNFGVDEADLANAGLNEAFGAGVPPARMQAGRLHHNGVEEADLANVGLNEACGAGVPPARMQAGRLHHNGVDEADLANAGLNEACGAGVSPAPRMQAGRLHHNVDESVRRLMAFEVDRAEAWLRAGLPLVERLPGWLAGDIWLVTHGGLKILQKIRAARFDVWSRRPRVSRWDQAGLLASYLLRRMTARMR